MFKAEDIYYLIPLAEETPPGYLMSPDVEIKDRDSRAIAAKLNSFNNNQQQFADYTRKLAKNGIAIIGPGLLEQLQQFQQREYPSLNKQRQQATRSSPRTSAHLPQPAPRSRPLPELVLSPIDALAPPTEALSPAQLSEGLTPSKLNFGRRFWNGVKRLFRQFLELFGCIDDSSDDALHVKSFSEDNDKKTVQGNIYASIPGDLTKPAGCTGGTRITPLPAEVQGRSFIHQGVVYPLCKNFRFARTPSANPAPTDAESPSPSCQTN